ncbi:ATP-dependent RNA helicase dbp7 [Tulasnella sp. JGI-2019a]|nr:ATP-dependent RNA helicase dbp7 [Tulasnella sp. JGI-2019a]
MDDGLILNLDYDDSHPGKASSSSRRRDHVSRKRQKTRDATSRDDDIGKERESERPKKRQRVERVERPDVVEVAAALSPLTTSHVLSRPKTTPSSSKAQQSNSSNRPAGQVVSSLFTSNPTVTLPASSKDDAHLQTPSNAPLTDASSSFSGLGLNPLLVSHLQSKMNIDTPTAVQRSSLSAMINQAPSYSPASHRDLFVQSQTGSGKTLAFLLPIINDLLPLSSLSYIDRSIGTLAIIIAPTRELAKQISDVLELLLQMRLSPKESERDEAGADTGPRLTRWLVSGLLTGGSTRTHEKARLRKGVPILVSTPGRLLDHLQNTESFAVAKCRWLILDEADRLMELGFHETLEGIIKSLDGRRKITMQAAKDGGGLAGEVVGGWDWGVRRRTILCSATMREDVQKLAGTALTRPIIIKGSVSPDNIAQPKMSNVEHKREGNAPAGNSNNKFTPPSQLSQRYVLVPLKLRLVTLVALLRSILTQANSSTKKHGGEGSKIIVFLSCTDSVDFHWELLRGASMSPEPEGPQPQAAADNDDGDSDDDDGEDEVLDNTPKEIQPQTRADGRPFVPIEASSPLLPDTSVFRLHGNLPLPARQAAIKGFSRTPAKYPPVGSAPHLSSSILLCTSVASRGLDLPLVCAVVQYDLPTEGGSTEYVHRVGRTARAGKGGESWAFVGPEEVKWVDWVQEKMEGDVDEEADGEISSLKAKGKARLVPISADQVLKNGLGGKGAAEVEGRATDVQLAFERWVIKSKTNVVLAQKAFKSHMRAYATHPSDEKHIFHVRNLHIGHLAKAFALRDAPSNVKNRSDGAKDLKNNGKNTRMMGSRDRKRMVKGRSGAGDDDDDDDDMARRKNDIGERMKDVVRAQGRLSKRDGKFVSGGGVDEFQVAGTQVLEKFVNRTR